LGRSGAFGRAHRRTELYALLRAGDVAFAVQRELSKRLADQLRERLPETASLPPGFDRLFVATYNDMNDEERHGVGFPRQGATILAKVLGHPTPQAEG